MIFTLHRRVMNIYISIDDIYLYMNVGFKIYDERLLFTMKCERYTVNLEIFSEQNLVFKVIKESVKKTVQWQGVKNMTFFKGFPIKP